jgi:hypothetical protein
MNEAYIDIYNPIFEILQYMMLDSTHTLYKTEQTSKKAEIVNYSYYYQWQMSKPSGKREAKRSFTVSVKTSKRDGGKRYFERYYRNGSFPSLREIKMNRHVFMSINRMRASHSSLKASLKRFNIMSRAQCACGDELQTEQHIFWDYKLNEDQRKQ